MLYQEESKLYNYGWTVINLDGEIDLSKDAIKTNYDKDLKKVRLDNNIIRPNNWYRIGFYVQGNDTYVKGMYAILSNEIYIGTPPKKGLCKVTPLIGISTVTKFTIYQSQWID